jgi:diguanylate cyclase (GGDEF)-like protein
MAEQALTSFSHHIEDKPVVLIADDSRVVRVSLKNILKENCTIIEAENGQQAWDILCATPSVTLIFSDLSMPKLDGRSLLSKIRTSDSTQIATTPFIVVTGNEESLEIRQELVQLGANEVINKPFNPSNIKNFLTKFANRTQDSKQAKTDCSQQDQIEQQTDFIDGIIDKAQFIESSSRELAFAIRNKNELSVALIRIDQINEITQHYSDPAIEHILLTLVEIINQHIHPDDTLAYFGDGLFALLRPASNAIGTRYLGRRILEDLSSKQFYLGESEQIVSASMGISAPNIKPGARTTELIALAEQRLKTAIENGGNKVIDKGAEKQAQINLVGDTSELSIQSLQSSNCTGYSHSSATHNNSEIHRLTAEQAAEIKAKYSNNLDKEDELSSELIEHKQTIDRLTNENRQLINEITHWKNQSAEAENLRRQLFEVESQQQQLQVKFTKLHDENKKLTDLTESITNENKTSLQQIEAVKSENSELLLRAEKVALENKDLLQRIQRMEIENQNLDEVLRNNANSQTQHFYEEENRRLEHQINEITSRAEKAEVENVKSNQLVNSLNDNIKLLQIQLDQSQQQLTEALDKQQIAAKTRFVDAEQEENDTKVYSHQHSNAELFNDTQNTNSTLKATPDSNLYSEKNEPSSVHLFPEKDQIEAKQQVKNRPIFPPFRVEPEPMLFKNGIHLSSFTIASMIFIVMLLIGGIYLYTLLGSDPTVSEMAETTATEKGLEKTSLDSSSIVPMTSQASETRPTITKPPIDIEKTDSKIISNKIRLEKESMLRKLAEEEFNHQAK